MNVTFYVKNFNPLTGEIFQNKLLIMHSIQNPFENLLKFAHAFNSHTLGSYRDV